MAATYTTLSDIKRVLKSSDKEIVRFSNDALVSVNSKDSDGDTNMDLMFDYSQVSIDSAFDDSIQYEIVFTDLTTFDVFKVVEKVKYDLEIDSGQNIGSDYTSSDGVLTIPSSAWSGTIEQDDKIILKLDCHMSEDNAIKYIEESEVEIDAYLTAYPVEFFEEDNWDRLFNPSDSRPVPNSISVAATYLSAYHIYTDTFTAILKEQSGYNSSYAKRWLRKAEKMINMYIDTKGYATPEAEVFPKFIDKFGVVGEGPGLGSIDDDWDRDAETQSIFENDIEGLASTKS